MAYLIPVSRYERDLIYIALSRYRSDCEKRAIEEVGIVRQSASERSESLHTLQIRLDNLEEVR